MSGRTLNTDALGLGDEVNEPVVLAMLDFVGEPTFVHSSVGVISWGGEDWYGLGALGRIDAVQERLGYSASRVQLTLSVIAGDYLNSALNENTWGRLAELWLGNYSGSGLVTDPELLIRGRMGPAEARFVGKDAVLSLIVEDIRGTLDRVNGRRASMLDHQQDSVGDTFYEWLPRMLDHRYTFNGGAYGGNNLSTGDTGGSTFVVPPWPFPIRP